MARDDTVVLVESPGRTTSLPTIAFQGQPSTLCKGCGHNSITSALIEACKSVGLDPYHTVKISGIGCSSKTPAYFLQYSHGMPSVATGALVANRLLTCVGVSGDGDTANIGLGQFKHACRRNLPIAYLIEDNGCYGLTKGQFSATSDLHAHLRREAGEENILPPFDLCLEAITAGATYVGRSFAGDRKQLLPLLKGALRHRGTAVLDIISPCVTFNDFSSSTKSWEWAKAHEEPIQEIGFVRRLPEIEVEQEAGTTTRVQLHDGSWITLRALSHSEHDVKNRGGAMRFLVESQERGEFLTGLMYVNTERPDFVDLQEMCDQPLSHLSDDDLRPSPEILSEILAKV